MANSKGVPPNYIRQKCLGHFEKTVEDYLERLAQIVELDKESKKTVSGALSVAKEFRDAAELFGKYGGLARIDITSGDMPIQGIYDWTRLTADEATTLESLLKKATMD